MTNRIIKMVHRSGIVRPSNLGKWSACARKTYTNIVAPKSSRGIMRVSQWVGDASHAVLAGEAMPDIEAYMLYDAITPNATTGRVQVEEIVSTTLQTLGGLGLEPVAWEVPVATDDVEGTLDVLLKDESLVPKFTIGDLKTGQRIPAGTWLQLGQYFDAYASMPDTNLSDWILLLHVPRTPLDEPMVPHTEFRQGPQCAAVAGEWVKTITGWLETASMDSVLPSPGYECLRCDLTVAQCPVRLEKEKN